MEGGSKEGEDKWIFVPNTRAKNRGNGAKEPHTQGRTREENVRTVNVQQESPKRIEISNRKWKMRPEALLVKIEEGKTYADVFKQVARNNKESMTGIKLVKRSRNGDLLMEFEKNEDLCKTKRIVEEALGEELKLGPCNRG